MPELPEVETTKRGIRPHIEGESVTKVTVRHYGLRWPVPKSLARTLKGQTLHSVTRRAKYLLLKFDTGHVIWHLGMSGNIRIVATQAPAKTHDHIDITFSNGKVLRYCDPRRFGFVLWTKDDVFEHARLVNLGPEPLSEDFNGEHLFTKSRKKQKPLKTFVMDNIVVVGVGNIYANEALFRAQLHPLKKAGSLTRVQDQLLSEQIKNVLAEAIKQGGTTLKDFVGGDGKPGYFVQKLQVYGRGGKPCVICDKPLTEKKIGQRTTVYCTRCQRN